jgi:phage regulator Rha-like protein
MGEMINFSVTQTQTMTSKEIAELTGKNHADVMRDIRNLQDQVGTESIFALSFIINELPNGGSKQLPMYSLDKKQTLLLISGYNALLRLKIINRWEELENKNLESYKVEDPIERAKAWIREQEAIKLQIQEANEQKTIAENKVKLLTHVEKMYTATEIAKECGLSSAIALNMFLSQEKIHYKVNDTWVPYSEYSNKGYFHLKQEVLDTGKVIYHRKITQMGREFIIDLINKKASN